jgi:hypothetical protein
MSLRSPLLYVGLALGLAGGLLYGWVLHPAAAPTAAPASLRQDYRTDYVLMVAEAYQSEGDIDLAAQRLAQLGPATGAAIVDDAVAYANRQGFAASDMELLSQLARDLNAAPAAATASP